MPNTCRAHLSHRDLEFISVVLTRMGLSQNDALTRLLADPGTLDLILEDPNLLDAVMSLKSTVDISAELYFYVLVRHSLKESGLDDRDLADYVAGTLAEFARGNPFSQDDADPLQVGGMPYHVDFIEAIRSATSRNRFYLHVRCGNQFLVLTGLFPEFIKQREKRRGAPGVRYYEGVAQQSYRTAMAHPLADEFALCEVYDLLTIEFRKTRRALNRMTREYLSLSGGFAL